MGGIHDFTGKTKLRDLVSTVDNLTLFFFFKLFLTVTIKDKNYICMIYRLFILSNVLQTKVTVRSSRVHTPHFTVFFFKAMLSD